jgi:hypothetical protein
VGEMGHVIGVELYNMRREKIKATVLENGMLEDSEYQ